MQCMKILILVVCLFLLLGQAYFRQKALTSDLIVLFQQSHLKINPNGIVAIGPDLEFNKPHGRQ